MNPAAGDSIPTPALALDLVWEAARGVLPPAVLADRLGAWIYAPRRRSFATFPRQFLAPNSLDAVDIAYFEHGLLTDGEYDDIMRTAVVRRVDTADVEPRDGKEVIS